jgi:hypothetical protein
MRAFLFMTSVIALLLVAAALAIEFLSVDPTWSGSLQHARELVWALGGRGWEFLRPLLQLIIVFLILDWLLARLGVQLKLNEFKGSVNVQTFIACIIIATFCIAVLAGLNDGLGYLKDVVLIVIGFYFGTRARPEVPAATIRAPQDPPAGYESTNESPYSGGTSNVKPD